MPRPWSSELSREGARKSPARTKMVLSVLSCATAVLSLGKFPSSYTSFTAIIRSVSEEEVVEVAVVGAGAGSCAAELEGGGACGACTTLVAFDDAVGEPDAPGEG